MGGVHTAQGQHGGQGRAGPGRAGQGLGVEGPVALAGYSQPLPDVRSGRERGGSREQPGTARKDSSRSRSGAGRGTAEAVAVAAGLPAREGRWEVGLGRRPRACHPGSGPEGGRHSHVTDKKSQAQHGYAQGDAADGKQRTQQLLGSRLSLVSPVEGRGTQPWAVRTLPAGVGAGAWAQRAPVLQRLLTSRWGLTPAHCRRHVASPSKQNQACPGPGPPRGPPGTSLPSEGASGMPSAPAPPPRAGLGSASSRRRLQGLAVSALVSSQAGHQLRFQ